MENAAQHQNVDFTRPVFHSQDERSLNATVIGRRRGGNAGSVAGGNLPNKDYMY